MAYTSHVLLFPHEHTALLEAIHDLSVRARTRPKLRTFLDKASQVLHREAAALTRPERDSIGEFDDLVDLAERHVRKPDVVVETTLVTTFQIGQLLVFAENHPGALSDKPVDTFFPVGYGIGLIAAAVAATATTADAIIALGLEAVAVAARLAADLQRTSKDIEDSEDAWSRVIAGVGQEELEQQLAMANANCRPLQTAYIAQILPDAIVVMGPPSTLDTLSHGHTWKMTQATAHSTVPARCLMFGPHLPPIDDAKVVGTAPVLGEAPCQRPLYSGHTTVREALAPNTCKTLGDALRVAVATIAHRPVQVELAFLDLAAGLRETGNKDVALTTVGSGAATSKLCSILEKHGQNITLAECEPAPAAFGNVLDSVSRHEIAVVGMSGRFPESDSLDELWSLLSSGKTTHREIPSSRFNVDDFYDASRRTHNALLSRHGCFIRKPGDFDHRLFNISPREAAQMDPVQRMFLMTTYEALEMAGYSPTDDGKDPMRIATYFGQTVDDWKTINEQQGIDTHFLPAVNRSFAPGRIAHYFRWAGGFYSIDTGCSSSATALCLAREALASGECDAAVVGGGTLLSAPEWFAGLSQGGFLSPTGACKTFSDAADGYCRGEGVAVVVLKRVADAVRNKDNILAVVAGAARNSNAGAGSITYPGAQAQAALYRRVLRQAGVRPQDVSVVEMHGTGTQAGDKVEMQALQHVFASPVQARRQRPLVVGAIKASLGHSEAASGVVSLIKSILMLRHNMIPPQPGQPFTLNPHLRPIMGADIQLANGQAWTRSGTTPRYALVNNFDAAGGNVSMLLHDTPSFAEQPPPTRPDERSHHVVVTSGRTVTSQKANKALLRAYLAKHPDVPLADLAYTTTARRMHHVHREAYVARSSEELLRQLDQGSADNDEISSEPTPSVVFAFTGQGSQYMGMGGGLYRTSPTFRRLLDSYQSLCNAQGLPCNILHVILASGEDVNSEWAARDMQVATVALEIALARYWELLGVRPTLVIGHSLGEYAALCVAGVFSVGDALAMAYERAALIFTRCEPAEASMLAVGLPASTVRWRLRDSAAVAGCEVTCVNGPSSTVVGGPVAAVEALHVHLNSDNATVATSRLRVPFAFHTRQMNPVLDDLELAAKRVKFNTPHLPVASSLLGRVVQPGEDGVFNARYLRRHTREPVAFLDAVRACEEQGLIQDQSLIIEIGPHPTCIGLISSSLQKVTVRGYPSLRRGRDDWESISQCAAAAYCTQLPVAWAEFHKDHVDSLRMVTDLPTYAFDKQEFWHSYKTKAMLESHAGKASPVSPPASSRLSTTCLHSVEQYRRDGSRRLATFGVDLTDQHLSSAIGGHVVDGVAICPASIFMDMAYTAAAYLDNKSRNASSSSSLEGYELTNLSMLTPLVLRDDVGLPRVFVEAVLDPSTDAVSVRFLSRKDEVASPVEHGSCLIRLNQSEAVTADSWSRVRLLVKARVRSLDESARPKQVHALDKSLFYKLFSEIVDYSASFHAVEEATVAADFQDAVMTIHCDSAAELGSFTCNPFAIDALIHIAGFLLNVNVSKPKNEVHIANHIGSLRVLGDLESDGPFRAYTAIRDQDAKTGTSLCDVYLTNAQDKLVALCTDICFKRLDRDFFAILTGSARAVPAKPRTNQTTPRCRWQDRSSSSSDDTSSETDTPDASSVSSLSDTVDLSAALLAIVAEHCGMTVHELRRSKGVTFSQFGVDSQMSISILAEFQRTTDVELPAAFFINFPTPDAVNKELGNEQLEETKVQERKPRSPRQLPAKVGRSTERSPEPMGSSAHLLSLVAESLGLEAGDLTSSTKLQAIGMDSMLSIRITSQFYRDTGIELPAAFFSEHPTVAAACAGLDGPVETAAPDERLRNSFAVSTLHIPIIPTVSAANVSALARQHKIDNAVSRAVLIQGQSRSCDAPLFMTCDGPGTVETYIHLSALPNDRRIYALESPFLESPETFDLSIQEMASIFIRTIRRLQPQGPYLIGGWSAGSVYAYEVAHRLTTQGETIGALIILDMRPPCPSPISIVTDDVFDKAGVFEGINRARDLPKDLLLKKKAHLMGTCRAMSRYNAPAFALNRQPRQVAVVWAKFGVENSKDAPIAAMCRPGVDIGKKPEQMGPAEFERYLSSWFYGRREQFGTNGWEDLLGDNISVHAVDGDHFSMMLPPFSTAVGKIVSDTVALGVGRT